MKKVRNVRNIKGRFVRQIKPQETIKLIQQQPHSSIEIGIFTLERAEKEMRKWGGSYIVQP